MKKSLPVLLLCLGLGLSLTTCEIINPDEQIPAFLQIDSFSFSTTAGQGLPIHSITDAWVYVDEQLVGVYELPASVPLLSEGATNLRIQPGIRVSGQVGHRSANPFMRDFLGTVNFFPDSHTVLTPPMVYEDWVTFKWMEDFEDQSEMSIANNGSISDGLLDFVPGADSASGNAMILSMGTDGAIAECSSKLAYSLPAGGDNVIMELTYRNNNSLYIGLISYLPSNTIQTPVLVLNPTDEWNHIYVNLTSTVSAIGTTAGAHQVYFGFIRDEGLEGEAWVMIDNIKLMH